MQDTVAIAEIQLRLATDPDGAALDRVAAEMNAHHEAGYFQRCLAEQESGQRLMIVAEQQRLLGYVQLVFQPRYAPFRRLGIPEIQDLNVVPAARRQGLGQHLVAAAEEAARIKGFSQIGISVGLHPGFGAAQRLYIKLGYVPDGMGVAYDEQTVTPNELRPLDDFLAIKMLKKLSPS